MPTHFDGSAEERRALDLFIKLARAAEAFGARTLGPIVDAGLTPVQFGVLEALYHLGALMPSQLAEKHLTSRNNLTSVVDRLEADGLVRRERCPSDRRAQWIHLTEEGRARVERVMPEFAQAVAREASGLSPQEQEQLNGLLRKLGRGPLLEVAREDLA